MVITISTVAEDSPLCYTDYRHINDASKIMA